MSEADAYVKVPVEEMARVTSLVVRLNSQVTELQIRNTAYLEEVRSRDAKIEWECCMKDALLEAQEVWVNERRALQIEITTLKNAAAALEVELKELRDADQLRRDGPHLTRAPQ